MLHDLIQSNWFWPILGISLMGYYVWVILTYFRSLLTQGISRFKGVQLRPNSNQQVKISWDELAMGFALHRRLLINPQTALDAEERVLLGKSPFKELIQQTTIQY